MFSFCRSKLFKHSSLLWNSTICMYSFPSNSLAEKLECQHLESTATYFCCCDTTHLETGLHSNITREGFVRSIHPEDSSFQNFDHSSGHRAALLSLLPSKVLEPSSNVLCHHHIRSLSNNFRS